MNNLFDIIAGTIASDRLVNKSAKESASELTFQRDENGILWSYDAAGKKVGRIFEHGDSQIDKINEV